MLAALATKASVSSVPSSQGLIFSSAGYFAEQGRGGARIRTHHLNLLDVRERLDCGSTGLTVHNMEMEAEFFLHILGGLGYRAAVVCMIINQRATGVFLDDYRQQLLDVARLIMQAFKRVTPITLK